MAFSLRKMLSNISYFTKPDDATAENDEQEIDDGQSIFYRDGLGNFQRLEADSTSKCESLQLPDSIKNYAAKKGSLSDTDILNITPKEKRKFKKLKLDIQKASKSLSDRFTHSEDSSNNTENTPKHILLECKSSDVFSEKLKKFNFDHSFDISDSTSNDSLSDDERLDIESLTDQSESELTEISSDDVKVVKMCRKVSENQSISPESFGDVEVGHTEEERINLLLNYQLKFEKIEVILKKLLTEFQFHIEMSKIFNPRINHSELTEKCNEAPKIMHSDVKSVSPSWDLLQDKEDMANKNKIHSKLQSIKSVTNRFLKRYLDQPKLSYGLTFDIHKRRLSKQTIEKKRLKHFDFPDLRDAMLNLFNVQNDSFDSSLNTDSSTCNCKCQCQEPIVSKVETDTSITSSIGNFTLDSTTLSAYSESLDAISYNSFDESNLYSTLLQKASMDRIIFYVQAHSIQVHCDDESKNVIKFHCPACNSTENEENGLIRHILSQYHCEKLHFVYKTAYIKKCVAEGKEIMPSTVLNSMRFYRDENKIVCFGDAIYACTLCFENLIVGESVLMAHCSDEEHLNRRDMLDDILG